MLDINCLWANVAKFILEPKTIQYSKGLAYKSYKNKIKKRKKMKSLICITIIK